MFFPFFLFFDAKSRPNGGVVGLLNRHAFFSCISGSFCRQFTFKCIIFLSNGLFSPAFTTKEIFGCKRM